MHRKKSRPAARTAPEFRRKTAPRPGGRGFFPAARRPGGPLPAGKTRHTPPEYPARFPAVRPGWCAPGRLFRAFRPSGVPQPPGGGFSGLFGPTVCPSGGFFPAFRPGRVPRRRLFPTFCPDRVPERRLFRAFRPGRVPERRLFRAFRPRRVPRRRVFPGFSAPLCAPKSAHFMEFSACAAPPPPQGGIRFLALIFGDRGPLTREFPTNSGVGVSGRAHNKKAALLEDGPRIKSSTQIMLNAAKEMLLFTRRNCDSDS